MAAPDSTVSRLGQINASGDAYALFLKQFGGEILTEFERATVFKNRFFSRQIRNGRTAQFPLIGSVTSSYHTPGTWIDGQSVKHAELTISIDGLLIAPVFLAQIDELMNHYDVRGPYATEMGRELAKQYDVNCAKMALAAARASNELTGRDGGSVVTLPTGINTTAEITADHIGEALYSAAQEFDEKDVGQSDRCAFLRPAQYYLMGQGTKWVNRDYAGAGSIASGKIEMIAGIDIYKSNNIPSTNVATGLSKYQGDFTQTVGIVATKWAVGTVQLMDISLESSWEIRNQGTFMLAKMAVGHGTLDVRCAVEIELNDA